MDSILKYKDLIKCIPVKKQSARIKRTVWENKLSKAKLSKESKTSILKNIFQGNSEIEISRKDIFDEPNLRQKIIKTLMWGYPSGGRGNNIELTLKEIEKIQKNLSKYFKQNISKEEALELTELLGSIKGLGQSTWSKLLYFFEISFDNDECQIFDLKIKDSLNKKQFKEFNILKEWEQNENDYFEYIKILSKESHHLRVDPDQIENFLFFYNLNYKF